MEGQRTLITGDFSVIAVGVFTNLSSCNTEEKKT